MIPINYTIAKYAFFTGSVTNIILLILDINSFLLVVQGYCALSEIFALVITICLFGLKTQKFSLETLFAPAPRAKFSSGPVQQKKYRKSQRK